MVVVDLAEDPLDSLDEHDVVVDLDLVVLILGVVLAPALTYILAVADVQTLVVHTLVGGGVDSGVSRAVVELAQVELNPLILVLSHGIVFSGGSLDGVDDLFVSAGWVEEVVWVLNGDDVVLHVIPVGEIHAVDLGRVEHGIVVVIPVVKALFSIS